MLLEDVGALSHGGYGDGARRARAFFCRRLRKSRRSFSPGVVARTRLDTRHLGEMRETRGGVLRSLLHHMGEEAMMIESIMRF